MNIIKQILDFLKNLLNDTTEVEPFVERKIKKAPKRVSKTPENKTIKKTKSAKKTKSTNKKTS